MFSTIIDAAASGAADFYISAVTVVIGPALGAAAFGVAVLVGVGR